MKTILIVDDEHLIANMLGYALEDQGYRVVKAGDGQHGLELLELEQPSLVITDFMMPQMNGLQLAQAIRSRLSAAELPILLMSGAHGNLGRATPDLFAAVFDKPFEVSQMVAKVCALVGPGN
ncbi:response regulator transcription factor [Pseudomonas sp. Gutcm_11s]|uniref:response regulator transcription factor n=1 Tax=Pseudomonas sp. Gutcm_11s TaxID=3026088 RepID=UPI00236133E5|nr:response regulator [Pseudomonas sp. Gutcm_11s]MDD0844364.1 response regulator [Pseudomonas sp. Gutcm_11s]